MKKHLFSAAVLMLIFAISGCTEVTPPEFNSAYDPLSASYPVPVPSILQASMRSSTEVVLDWSSWEYEKGYVVERSINGGAYEKIAALPALTEEYVDSGLDSTKSYSYRMKRFTDQAVSGYSRLVSLQPPVKGVLKLNVISSLIHFAGAFSHNGSYLATVYNSKYNQIVFWKPPKYDIDKYIPHSGSSVKVMSFNADDKLLACSTEDSSIYIYDVNSQSLSFRIKGIKGKITSMDFSPNGRFMAAALMNNNILIYDTNTWTVAYTLSRHTYSVNSVSFSKDGLLLASGSTDGTIILWNTADWTVNRIINTSENAVTSVAFRPDGQVIAAAAGMSYYQYETATGNKLRSFSAGGHTALSVAFSKDGKSFAGACGTEVSIFDSNNRPFPLNYGGVSGSWYTYNTVLPAPGDGLFVSVGYPAGLWAPETWTISYR